MDKSLDSIRNALKKSVTFIWVSGLKPAIGHVHWILLVLLAILAISSISLVVTHIYLEFGKTPPTAWQWVPDLMLWPFGTDSTKLSQGTHYGVVIADMIAICAFAFAVFPVTQISVSKVRLKRELRKAHGLQVFKVRNEGADDLAKMLEIYEGADHITVFCGHFDWLHPGRLADNEKYQTASPRQRKAMMDMTKRMRDFVVSYADQQKITLVSSKQRDRVMEALKPEGDENLFDLLAARFVFDQDVGIKCSLIKQVNDRYTFLYRSYSGSKGNLFNANIFGKAKESEELINILRKLIEFGDWENKVGQNQEDKAVQDEKIVGG